MCTENHKNANEQKQEDLSKDDMTCSWIGEDSTYLKCLFNRSWSMYLILEKSWQDVF